MKNIKTHNRFILLQNKPKQKSNYIVKLLKKIEFIFK